MRNEFYIYYFNEMLCINQIFLYISGNTKAALNEKPPGKERFSLSAVHREAPAGNHAASRKSPQDFREKYEKRIYTIFTDISIHLYLVLI